MHSKTIIHCDLKPANIMVELRHGGVHATIIDLEDSIREAETPFRTPGCTPRYTPPIPEAVGVFMRPE